MYLSDPYQLQFELSIKAYVSKSKHMCSFDRVILLGEFRDEIG